MFIIALTSVGRKRQARKGSPDRHDRAAARLVVDDEPAIRRFLRTSLSAQNYEVTDAENAGSALDALKRNSFDVLVLDLGLPDQDGFDVIRDVRERGSALPIIVLSSRADEEGKVKALDLGADDYVTKPFGVDELLARIRAAMRHRLQQEGEKPIFQSGDLSVDLVRRIVMARGQDVKLSPREYDLLRLLVQHAGKVLLANLYFVKYGARKPTYSIYGFTSARYVRKSNNDPERPQHILTEQGVGSRLSFA